MTRLWHNLSYRNRLLICFLLIIFLLSGLSFTSAHFITNIYEIEENKVENTVPELLWIAHWQKDVHLKRVILERFIELESFTYLANTLPHMDEGFLEPKSEVPRSLRPVEREINDLMFTYHNKVNSLLKYNNIEAAKAVVHNELLPQFDAVEVQLQAAYIDSYDELVHESESISTIIHQAMLALFVGTGVILSLAVLLSYRLSLRLSKPVNKLVHQVSDIAQGEYGSQVNTSYIEFEQLTQSINDMSSSLRQSFCTLQKEKQFREEILASIPIGIITVHDEYNDIQINATGKKLLNITDDQLHCLLNHTVESNDDFWQWYHSKQFFLTRKTQLIRNGIQYSVLVSQSPLLDEQNELIGRIYYFIDISEQEELEQRMFQADKLAIIGELAASSAHEIRNPLSVIQGFLQLMDQQASSANKEKFQIPLILEELKRINDIIEEMLMMAKPGAPKKRQTTVQHILQEIIPLMKASCPPNITLQVDVDEQSVCVDGQQIKQVLLNLIRNSIEALGTQVGEISIYTKRTEDGVHIYIKDTGPGIPEQIKPHIFDPFVSSKSSGTGLGLTIVSRIIQSHGGTICLDSTDNTDSSKKGTTFKIVLPYQPAR